MRKLAFIFFVLLCACNKEVELKQSSIDPVIVVDAWIEHDRYAEVFLTKGFPVLAKYDSLLIFNTFLNHAKVELVDNKGNKEILTLYKDDAYFPPYVYKSIKMKGESGGSYHLKISVDGHVLTAETLIPTLPSVHFTYQKRDSIRMDVFAELEDNVEEENFYYYRTRRLGDSEIFLPSMESVFSDFSFNGEYFSKKLHQGFKENLVNVYDDDDETPDIKFDFLLSDTVFVRFSSVNKESFDMLNSTFLHIQSRDNPFTIATSKIKSNIEGGIGHFIGLGTTKGVVFVK